jgi:hypothetical protein
MRATVKTGLSCGGSNSNNMIVTTIAMPSSTRMRVFAIGKVTGEVRMLLLRVVIAVVYGRPEGEKRPANIFFC